MYWRRFKRLMVLAPVFAGVLSACAVAIRPGGFHEVVFRARIVSGPSLESHPQLTDLVPMATGRPDVSDVRFPSVAWTFREREGGAEIPRPFEGNAPITLFSSAWHTFTYRFHAPENAAWVEFAPVAGGKGSVAEITDLHLRELPSPENLVAHPSFADPYAPLGWSLGGGALYMTDTEGNAFAMAEGWAGGPAVTDFFPVKPGVRIEVSVTGSSARYDTERPQMLCSVVFASSFAAASRKEGVKAAKTLIGIKGRNKTVKQVYRVPEGMHWARLEVRHGIVTRVAVREVSQ